MTANWRMLVLVALLLLQPLFLKAQTDSLAFQQGRLRVWCETARFVYDDNEADSLLSSINCQSWEAFQNSLRSTEANLGVLRLMNTVDKPAVYSGYSSTEAKLQKLVSEIGARLKQSPARAKDPVRKDRVDSLAGQLLLAVRMVAPNEVSGSPAAISPAQTAPEMEEDEADLEQPPGELIPVEPKKNMPWNEILQWLALLLIGGYLFWRVSDQEQRYRRLKTEFRELEKLVNGFVIMHTSQPLEKAAPGDSLSEKEVREVVKEELRENQPASRPAAANTVSPKAQVPLPPPPVAEPKQAAVQQTQAVPAASAPAERGGDTAGLYYDKMPFRGGFHQNEMSPERQRDSLYTIRVLPGRPEDAEYWITEDLDVQRYAMQNGFSFFEEGCEFTEVDENPTRVVNEQKGRLRKDGAVWKILEKALVRFE